MRDYEFLKKLGLRVRAQREALGYTREAFAEQIGVSVNFCSDIELGKKGMSLETLVKMAKVLCVTIDYLLLDENQGEDTSALTAMLESCEKEKIPYLENIIKNFIQATSKD